MGLFSMKLSSTLVCYRHFGRPNQLSPFNVIKCMPRTEKSQYDTRSQRVKVSAAFGTPCSCLINPGETRRQQDKQQQQQQKHFIS